jgi:hypothetical protein
MNKLLTLFLLLALCSCSKEPACRPYLEAVKDSSVTHKTTIVNFNDSLSYELDYVRDQMYREKTFYCFGYLELNRKKFQEVAAASIKGYNPSSVIKINFIGKGKNMCRGDKIDLADIQAILVYYLDNDKYLNLDYTDFTTGVKESHKVSGSYSSVSRYYIFEKSKMKDKPFTVTLRYKYFKDDGTMRLISKSDDEVYTESTSN